MGPCNVYASSLSDFTARYIYTYFCSSYLYLFTPPLFVWQYLLINQISGKLHRKGKKGFYFFALIVLWISIMVSIPCDWIPPSTAFVHKSSTPLSILNTLNHRNLSDFLSIFEDATAILADIICDSILVRLLPISQAIANFCRFGGVIFYGKINISWPSLSHYLFRRMVCCPDTMWSL